MAAPDEKPIDLIADVNEAEEGVRQSSHNRQDAFLDLLHKGPMGEPQWYERLSMLYWGLPSLDAVTPYHRAAMKRYAYMWAYSTVGNGFRVPVYERVSPTFEKESDGVKMMEMRYMDMGSATLQAMAAMDAFRVACLHGLGAKLVVIDEKKHKELLKGIHFIKKEPVDPKPDKKIRKSSRTGATWPKPKGSY